MNNGKKDSNFNPLAMSELTRDAFRTLRMNISFSGGEKDVQTLVVTSTVPNEGKTSISIGIGVSMAESMKNTLIVECDCRRPSVGNRLKLRPKKNWIDVLYNEAELRDAVVPTECPNLYFLDVEPGLVHSVELLSSGRFLEMVQELRKNFDFIIFDTPPLGSFIDAAVLAEHADGALIVINSGSREVRLLRDIVEQLKKANAHILGIVLNRVNAHHSSSYRYGDYYYRKRDKATGPRQPEKSASRANLEKPPKKERTGQPRPIQRPDPLMEDEADMAWETYTQSVRTRSKTAGDGDTGAVRDANRPPKSGREL